MSTAVKTHTVKAEQGVHFRNAALISKIAGSYCGRVTFKKVESEIEVNAKNMLALTLMKLKKGSVVKVSVSGEFPHKTMQQILRLI